MGKEGHLLKFATANSFLVLQEEKQMFLITEHNLNVPVPIFHLKINFLSEMQLCMTLILFNQIYNKKGTFLIEVDAPSELAADWLFPVSCDLIATVSTV